ncbi:YtxH domain-containing protein [Porphyromonas sp. COT-239 OH1446]|uniref:YtxH domain-containing protein n=1 Tax=Porphyromonas sp. COT-239 OH1446 TaxID=1515613 RepID=UPI00052C035D|nr:YtxH domain-containing protein [Porphyromonas sp. COT-239 OH1446]KGN67717.1 hypothetical protein HQ37_07740 [Porphyromonas sp. COT-239 OH1446]
MANSNGRFALGLLIGAALGAAAAYFSDRNRREKFADDLSCTFDKAKDGLVESYYEAKDRYHNYRNKLVNSTEELLDEVRDELKELD